MLVVGSGLRSLADLMGREATLLISLDPECPVSQLYTPLLDSLAGVLPAHGVGMIGFHPSPFTNTEAVRSFMNEALPKMPHVVDSACQLAQALDCRVMPEVFLIDANGTLRYRGAMDDRVVRAGRKKPHATRHPLKEALQAVLGGQQVMEARTVAHGCIVECGAD